MLPKTILREAVVVAVEDSIDHRKTKSRVERTVTVIATVHYRQQKPMGSHHH